MPTTVDTPALAAACSLERPVAIAVQNSWRSGRWPTGGRPGEHNLNRPDKSGARPRLVIAPSTLKVLQRPFESTQYTAIEFGRRCKQMGVRPSMGSVGDAYDNAMVESFFASLECELIDRRSFKTKTEARLALFTYIEGWYNPRRRHSALGYRSPANFESTHRDVATVRVEHGLPTAGVTVACATPPVDNPATRTIEAA